jgi:hypothetical protein
MRFVRNQQALVDGVKYADIRWAWIISFHWCEILVLRINRKAKP